MLWARAGLGHIQRSFFFFFSPVSIMTITSLNFKCTGSCKLDWTDVFWFMCFYWNWLTTAMQNMFLLVCERKAVILTWAATFLSWLDPKPHPHILKSTGRRISSWIWPWALALISKLDLTSEFVLLFDEIWIRRPSGFPSRLIIWEFPSMFRDVLSSY